MNTGTHDNSTKVSEQNRRYWERALEEFDRQKAEQAKRNLAEGAAASHRDRFLGLRSTTR